MIVRRIRHGIFAFLLACAIAPAFVFFTGCGGRKEPPPDDLDIPTTLPRVQVLYREARETFLKWMTSFDNPDEVKSAYGLMTRPSKVRLRASGVSDAESFASWFAQNRGTMRIPFVYSFSRVDVLDVDLKDTSHAVLTASFIVSTGDKQTESVGSFYLIRENNAWRIPFAESNDFMRSWWEQEAGFNLKPGEKGLTSYVSRKLNIRVSYPISWDVDESPALPFPEVPATYAGFELSYINPVTMKREAYVRVVSLPLDILPPEILADTTSLAMKVVRTDEGPASETQQSGKLYHLYSGGGRLLIGVYCSVETSEETASNFAEAFKTIVESISYAP